MKHRLPILLAAILLPPGLPSFAQDTHDTEDTGTGTAAWNYSKDSGPEQWAELDPAYVLARVGGSQSPIDISPAEAISAELPKLVVEGRRQPLHLINNGHTVEAIARDGATFTYLDRSYSLRQFHFHAPSEHTVNGKHAEVELHFVFADGEGHLAVLGVLFEQGHAEHPEIAELITNKALQPSGGEMDTGIDYDVTAFLPASHQYFTYDGSLTTPPATEGVRWFVFKQPLHLSRAQIEAIDRVYFSNNRPTQPLNARLVLTRR